MIVIRKIQGTDKLADFFRGTPIAAGSKLTNAAGSPDISVPVAADGEPDFSDVEVGDRFYISGENVTTVFLVHDKTDDQNIELDNNVAIVHATNGIWRAVRNDGFDPTDLEFPPQPLSHSNDVFVLVYDSSTFGTT
jgi:hypothetical protein